MPIQQFVEDHVTTGGPSWPSGWGEKSETQPAVWRSRTRTSVLGELSLCIRIGSLGDQAIHARAPRKAISLVSVRHPQDVPGRPFLHPAPPSSELTCLSHSRLTAGLARRSRRTSLCRPPARSAPPSVDCPLQKEQQREAEWLIRQKKGKCRAPFQALRGQTGKKWLLGNRAEEKSFITGGRVNHTAGQENHHLLPAN